MRHVVIDLQSIRQRYLAPNKCLRRCSNIGLLFWHFLLEMPSGMIPGLVLLRELEVFVKLLPGLDSETKYVMECVARGVNGMATEMPGAKYEPEGCGRLQ